MFSWRFKSYSIFHGFRSTIKWRKTNVKKLLLNFSSVIKFRKSLESSSFNNIEWVNFFLSRNHFFDQNSLFWGEFWSNDSVVRASPVFRNLDRNGAMLNETAITTALTWLDEEIGQCGSNPLPLNRRLDWKVCSGLNFQVGLKRQKSWWKEVLRKF